MKTRLNLLAALLLLATLNPQTPNLFAQGTAFTYQGRLNEGASGANGNYDLRFTIYDSPSDGTQQGGPLTNSPVNVNNGLFAVTLDFGGQFPGANRWLEIGVRTNGNGTFSTLSPRQKITPAPYAIFAGTVSTNGLAAGTYASAVDFNNPANSFSGNGTGLTNVNAATLGGLGAANYWNLGGNGGVGGPVLGTVDSQPLNLISWNSRVLRLETVKLSLSLFDSVIAVNTVGGASGNVISNGVLGGTIAGGGAETNHLFSSEIEPNTVLDNFSTVGGGINNTAGYASGDFDDARSATVAGGENNTASGGWATVGGGQGNIAYTGYSFIGGGQANGAGGSHSFIGGGSANSAGSSRSLIAGGGNNLIQDDGFFGPSVFASGSSIGGGEYNSISAIFNFFGFPPVIRDSLHAVIGGGWSNSIVGGSYGMIPGGQENAVKGSHALAAGRRAKAIHDGAFVWADSTDADFASTAVNQFSIRATGGIFVSDNTPNLSFGSTTRQMLNLWGTQYGIGVQGFTTYFRTDGVAAQNGFSWYKGGVHSDTYADAGGGIELMHLIDGGLFVHGTYNNTSDRDAKENFTAIEPREVLAKVLALPITRWNYKHDAATPHLGPVAQDFYAAFAVGPDEKHISTVDESGVALAAIQGLNEKTEGRSQRAEVRIQKLEAENAELKQRLETLEKYIRNQKSN